MNATPETPRPHVGAVTREEAPGAFVRNLFSALHVRRLRGPLDPRSRERAEALCWSLREAAEEEGRVRIRRSGPHLIVNRARVRPYPDVRLPVRLLLQDLERLGLGGLELAGDLDVPAIEAFLDRYAGLEEFLARSTEYGTREGPGGPRPVLRTAIALVDGITLLPPLPDAAAAVEPDDDRRGSARRTFYRALAAARSVMRQFAVQKIPELRKSRAIVHEMIDNLIDEEFSLLGLTAIQDFDPYTFQHSVHVSILSMAMGQGLGLPRRDLTDLGVAALFHDMGKVRVPRNVLDKPGRFDQKEWAVMRMHPLAGARELLRYGGVSDLAVKVMLVSVEHHMRFDASGYPSLGESWQQGLFSRIVSLADCYDAMTASRAYMKRPFTPDAVVRYMLENAGRMFDPDLLRLFVAKVGLFPVGSLVRLASGELALVMEPPAGAREIERPRVRILRQAPEGWTSDEERLLAEGPPADPRLQIKAGCHPHDYGVDVDGLLARFYLDAA